MQRAGPMGDEVERTDQTDAEPATAESPSGVAAPGASSAPPTVRRHLVRRTVAWILVVLVSILVPLSVVTVWAVRTVTNTDRYVATIGPVAQQKVVTDYIALEITNKLFDSLNVQKSIENVLPKKASAIAAPVTTQLKGFTNTRVSELLHSQYFATFWNNANRKLHATLVDYLTGKKVPAVTRLKSVGVDLTPVVDKAVKKLDAKGVTFFDPLQNKLHHALQFTLLDQQQVKKVQTLFRAVKSLGWLLPLITLILLIIAVAVAVDRRKTLLRAAVGSAIAIVVFIAVFLVGKTYFINHAKAPSDVTDALWSTVTRFLHDGLVITLIVAVVLAIILWFIGPSRPAVWLRHQIAQGARWLWRHAGTAASWCDGHQAAVRLTGIVIAALWIIFSGSLSDGTAWLILLLLVAYLLLAQLVFFWGHRRAAAGRAPGAPGPDDGGGPAGGEPSAAAVSADAAEPATSGSGS
ncbi:MAG TPA: hypothetical protein VKG43_05825 [Acidimicrobiales bacterium]|nr:hypothetical protein [Acidimicrobiales bacterium]